MKHTDEYIKEIFSNKLGEYESHVSPELWSNIASQLPQAAATTAASTTAVVAKTVTAKLIWTAAAVALTVASVVTYLTITKEENHKGVNEQSITNSNEVTENVTTNTESANDNSEEVQSQASIVESSNSNNVLPKENVESGRSNIDKEVIKPQEKSKAPIPHSIPARDIVSTPQAPIVSAPSQTDSQGTNKVDSSKGSHHDSANSPQTLTAQYTAAVVSKEGLRYFFMPQFTDGVNYSWDFGNGAQSTERSPMYSFEDEGIYQVRLTITDGQGQSKTIEQKITAYKPGKIEAPNIFTPNGDGQNDLFDVIEKSTNVTIDKIVVINNGGFRFESNGDVLWDGNNAQGSPMPAGEYQYFISGTDKEGNKVEKKGFVTLRRT